MTAIVGLDVGTTAVKAIAIAPDGTVLARAEAGYPLSTPRPGWAEQDPELWWEAAERAQAQLGVPDVAGIGLSGQMHGLVALDDADRVIRPALLWNDQRTAAQCAAIEERVGRERLIALTGNGALTGFTAPKLLWLRDEEPESYARIARVMLPKDLVRLRLTGEHATDVTDASGTLLFDVARRRVERRGARRARRPGGLHAAGARVLRGQRPHAGRRARRGRAPGIRRRARSASASWTRAARSRSSWAPRASSSGRFRPSPPTTAAGSRRHATPCRPRGTSWA